MIKKCWKFPLSLDISLSSVEKFCHLLGSWIIDISSLQTVSKFGHVDYCCIFYIVYVNSSTSTWRGDNRFHWLLVSRSCVSPLELLVPRSCVSQVESLHVYPYPLNGLSWPQEPSNIQIFCRLTWIWCILAEHQIKPPLDFLLHTKHDILFHHIKRLWGVRLANYENHFSSRTNSHIYINSYRKKDWWAWRYRHHSPSLHSWRTFIVYDFDCLCVYMFHYL